MLLMSWRTHNGYSRIHNTHSNNEQENVTFPSVQDNATRRMHNQAILVIAVFKYLQICRAASNGHSLQQSCIELYKKKKILMRMLWLYLWHTEHVWFWQPIGPYLTPRIIISLQKLLLWAGCPHLAILWYCCRLSCRTFPQKILGTFGPE